MQTVSFIVTKDADDGFVCYARKSNKTNVGYEI
jgi:hypothetical protein